MAAVLLPSSPGGGGLRDPTPFATDAELLSETLGIPQACFRGGKGV